MNIPGVLHTLFRRPRVNFIITLKKPSEEICRKPNAHIIRNCKYNVYSCKFSQKYFNSSIFHDCQSYLSTAIIHTSSYSYKSNNSTSNYHSVNRLSTRRDKSTGKQVQKKIQEIILKENIWTIPNFLCATRIGLSPVIAYCVVSSQLPTALGLLAFAAFTDLIDGLIARKVPGQMSVIGSYLDPLADKILVATLFLSLTWVNLIPYQLTILIIGRDLLLMMGAFYIRYKSMPAPRTISRYFDASDVTVQMTPTLLSKINTAFQLTLVSSMLAAPVFMFPNPEILTALCWVTATTTLGSGVQYLVGKNGYKFLRNIEKQQKKQS